MKNLIAILLICLLAACSPGKPSGTVSPTSNPPLPPEPPIILEDKDNPMEAGERYGATTEKTTQVRWLIPVLMNEVKYRDACARMEEMLNRINAKLIFQEIQLEIELRQITLTRELWPPKLRDTKCHTYSVMNDLIGVLTSKEEYDLISVPTGHASATRLADMGLLRNMASDLHNYPALMDVLEPQQLETLRYSGGIWGIPAGFDAGENLVTPHLAYHTETASSLGLYDADDLNSLGDLLYAVDRAANSDLPNTMYVDFTLDAYRREYPQYPFKVSEDFVFLYTQDGKVAPYAGSDVMTADVDLVNRIWRANRTPEHGPPVISVGVNMARDKQMFERTFDFIQSLNYVPDEKRDEYAPLLLANDKPNMLYHNPYGTVINVIPSQATAYGLVLLDIIYSDRSIYEEFRDTEELFGAGSQVALSYGLSPSVSVYPNMYASDWAYMNGRIIDIHHFNLFDCVKQSKFDPNEATQHYTEFIEGATYTPMPWDGFVFDPTPVMAEYAHVAERSWGFRMESEDVRGPHPATNIPEIFIGLREVGDLTVLTTEIYNAGMDIVLEECRRQYEQYLNGTNWQGP